MDKPDAKPPSRFPVALLPPSNDPLKHFAKDGPWFRLGALLIDKLPKILWAASVLLVPLSKAKGWW